MIDPVPRDKTSPLLLPRVIVKGHERTPTTNMSEPATSIVLFIRDSAGGNPKC